MTFLDIQDGAAVFVDANTFVYHFGSHSQYGPASSQLLGRIEQQLINGYTSAHVLNEVIHRLMAQEACDRLGWAHQGVAGRMRRHPNEMQQLVRYRLAIDEISLLGIQVLPVDQRLVSLSVDMVYRFGLLSSDALLAALMMDQGLSQLASNDADFDRVSGITRYGPI